MTRTDVVVIDGMTGLAGQVELSAPDRIASRCRQSCSRRGARDQTAGKRPGRGLPQ
jgi:hypothetical protein